MKKLIASLLVLVFGATMVMAEVPAPGAETREAVAVSTADFDDVEGVGLGELESEEVKGGITPAVAAAYVVGCAAANVAGTYVYAIWSHPKFCVNGNSHSDTRSP